MGLHFIKNGTKHDVCVKRPSLFPASATTYDNSQSGLAATRVQGAIDELAEWGTKNTITPLVGESWTDYGDCYYRKRGTTVELNLSIKNADNVTSAIVATLPAGFRPVHSVGVTSLCVLVGGAVTDGGMYIDTSGVIRMTNGNGYYIGRMYFETV